MLTSEICLQAYDWTILGIHVFDVTVLVPILFFAAYLLVRVRNAIRRIKEIKSLAILLYYIATWMLLFLYIVRTILFSVFPFDVIDEVLHILLGSILLYIESSIITFMLLGFLDVRKALLGTCIISLFPFSLKVIAESTLFFGFDSSVMDSTPDYLTTIYIFVFNACVAMVYAIILLGKFTPLAQFIPPTREFNFYAQFMIFMRCLRVLGAAMELLYLYIGFCGIELSLWFYYSLFPLLLYRCFLYPALSQHAPEVLPTIPLPLPIT